MDFKLELKGLNDLTRKLEGRIRRLEQSILRKALEAFAEPIRAAGEQYGRRLISPRLKYVVSTKLRGSTGTVRIGPSTEPFETLGGRTFSHANIAYWWEFGYDLHVFGRAHDIRHMGARPSMTPAYQAQKDRGLEAFEQVIRENLEQEVPG